MRSKLPRTLPLIALLFAGLYFSPTADAVGGQALGWGYNFSGTVGNGTTDLAGCYCVPTPTPVSVPADVTQIDGGYEQGLAVRADGTVMAWGYNYAGQVGDGTDTDRPTPVAVPGLTGVIAVSAGSESSLALRADGTLMAWGENQFGALGIGTDKGPESCTAVSCSKVPIPVPGISNAIAIASGSEFNLALLADGTVLGWGHDLYGSVGDGVGVQAGCGCVPSPVPVPGVAGAMAIGAGSNNGAALLSDGTMRNWGFNRSNQLGTGVASEPPCYCLPAVSPLGVGGVRQLAVGGGHGVALLSSGAVQSWGYNPHGQTGNGFPSTVGCDCVPTPITVPGVAPRAITAGTEHTMALLADGTGLAWGEGGNGQLGNGGTADAVVPTAVDIAGASELVGIEYGGFAIVGPSEALKVALAGAGSGKVGGKGVLCPPSCATTLPQGQVETLRAEPDPGSGFAGFSGPCAGTGACRARLDSDQTVTATFGPPVGTKITRARIKSPRKRAIFSFTAPGAITGYQCKLVRPRPKKQRRKQGRGARSDRKKGKRRKARFSGCATPKAYKRLRPGRYTFKVRALDILGADARPATRHFRIKKPKHQGKSRKHRS